MKIPTYRGTSHVSINMTPMIDVTFLLIIFFLVSSHLAKQENFIELALPTSNSGLMDANDRPTLTIQVLESGQYRVGSQDIVLDQVRRVIQQRNSEDADPVRIRIRTDKKTPYEFIASLLRICALTGNSDVVFAVYEEEVG
jgi:biopolymer transport protein ExbD